MNKKFIIKNKGFTLVETLVAIAILSLAVTGPMVIAQKGLGSSIYARDEVTAFYLAEEAVEYVRDVRDTNRIGGYGSGWLSQFQTAGCIDTSGQKCQIDATVINFNDPFPGSGLGAAINQCPVQACVPISYNSYTKLYGYGTGGTWSPTQFTRTVDIKQLSLVEAVVTVTISWQTGIFVPQQSFTVAEHIFAF